MRNEVAKLSDELQRLVKSMLKRGATITDTVAAVEECGESITLEAVAKFMRAHPTVQRQRVRRTLEATERLKVALGRPGTPEAELAEAALFTGVISLQRRGLKLPLKLVAEPRSRRQKAQSGDV
jgi:hypothetical protein